MSGLSGWKMSAALKTFRSNSVPMVLALPMVLSVSFIALAVAADTAYQAAVQKAENTKFYAVQKATADRVKVLKQAMTEATKSGDLDAANAFKSRIESAEQAGGTRAKPKNTVKFGGHEYALIEEKATWHVAKRICEEMGGHLAVLNTPPEADFLRNLAGKNDAWAGATDEHKEDDWTWVDGTKCSAQMVATWRTSDDTGEQHHLVWFNPESRWVGGRCGARLAFLCEWE